jgi:hypothetical protein
MRIDMKNLTLYEERGAFVLDQAHAEDAAIFLSVVAHGRISRPPVPIIRPANGHPIRYRCDRGKANGMRLWELASLSG